MIVRPNTISELQQRLAEAGRRGEKITGVDLSALSRLIEHAAEDMTVTVEAGMTLGSLQNSLRERQQWLPIDPPQFDRLTIGEVLANNASGPRRLGHGTIRDYVLGMSVALPSGELIRPGGKVVKNVAGYDLAKLFIGARGSLGVIVEATFKLKPLPEAEAFVQAQFERLDQTGDFIESVVASSLDPIVLDLHNVPPSGTAPAKDFIVVIGFAGASEDVTTQLDIAAKFGARQPSRLDYSEVFAGTGSPATLNRRSVLPSEVVKTIQALGPVMFMARAGNGIIEYRGSPSEKEIKGASELHLMRGIKDAYDPQHILPDLSL